MADSMELSPEVYAHLRAIAGRIHAQHGSRLQTIQPTVLLHEAWMKLGRSSMQCESREHFMATAARAMRQIIVDRARYKRAQKRGGEQVHTTLSGVPDAPDQVLDVMELDRALDALKEINASAAEVVLLRTFGGLNNREIATVLSVSSRTVDRNWRFAKAFLSDQLSD